VISWFSELMPEQIAEVLALARQELDLLLKIHQIVISKIN
jgi:hypothetical protein